jgi:hypothetical protein
MSLLQDGLANNSARGHGCCPSIRSGEHAEHGQAKQRAGRTKKVGANCPADFRPITMIHSFAKLISKILSLRLAPRLNKMVDRNQNAFIHTRSIHDNFKYIQRAAILIWKKKVPMLPLKRDISKAFDTLSWPFLMEVLQAHGFRETWRGWIESLLSTATSRIILNGHHGPPI